MSDAAFRNAVETRDRLLAERAQLSARRKEIEAELAAIDRFVAEWRRFAGIDSPVEENDTEQGNRFSNPPKEVVGDAVEAILRTVGGPMSRRAIFNALRGSGIELQGKDPQMVLSTMLWRMKDRFVRLPAHGYWLRDVPFPPARYDPHDLILAFA